MRATDIERLLSAIEAQRVRPIRDNYMFCCPFAPWTHGKKTDRTPSMEISINAKGESLFHCFACGESGTLSTFMTTLNSFTGGRFLDLERWVWGVESDLGVGSVQEHVLEFFAPKPVAPDSKPIPAEQIAQYAGKVPQYILDRGVPLEFCKRWELGYDEANSRVTFPVKDMTAKLVGLVGRAINPDTEPRYYNYWNFPKSNYLFGEWLLTSAADYVLVAEGMISTIMANVHGLQNCVGLMGSKVSTEQLRKLRITNRPIYLAVDMDREGNICREMIYNHIQDGNFAAPVFDMKLPRNDPADCSKDEFMAAFEAARLLQKI